MGVYVCMCVGRHIQCSVEAVGEPCDGYIYDLH